MSELLFFIIGATITALLAVIYKFWMDKKSLLKIIKDERDQNRFFYGELSKANGIILKMGMGVGQLSNIQMITPPITEKPKKKKEKDIPPVEPKVIYNVDDILKEIGEKGYDNISQEKKDYLDKFNKKS